MGKISRGNSLKTRLKPLFALFIGCIVLGILLLRLVALDADPPARFSPGFISDEGWWVHNARNAALFDEWIRDDFNQSLVISPLYAATTFLSYKLFGVTFFAARLPSALAGFFSVLILAFWSYRWNKSHSNNRSLRFIGKEYGSVEWQPLLVLLFCGVNFFFMTFNRVALVDSMMVLFLILGVFFWDSQKNSAGVYSAFCLWAALMTKPAALFIYPVLFLAWFVEYVTGKFRGKKVLYFCVTSAILFSGWFFLFYPDLFKQFVVLNQRFSNDNLPASLTQAAKGVISFFFRVDQHSILPGRFYYQAIFLFCGAFWLCLVTVIDVWRRGLKKVWEKLSFQENIAILWFVVGVLLLLPNQYKPERRFLFLVPPMVLMTVHLMNRLMGYSQSEKTTDQWIAINNKKWNIPGIAIVVIPLLPLFVSGFYLIFPELMMKYSPGTTVAIYTIAALAALSICSSLVWLFQYKMKLYGKHFPTIVIVFFCLYHTFFIVESINSLSWTLRDTSRYLGELPSKNNTIMGSVADTFCMENNCFAFTTFEAGPGNKMNVNHLQRFQPDYLVALRRIDNFVVPESELQPFKDSVRFFRDMQLIPGNDGSFRVEIALYRFIDTETR